MGEFNLQKQWGFNLHRVALLIRKELIRILKKYDLTPEQWQALATLWTEEPLNQREIRSLTMQDEAATSRMLVRMETNGWIERKKDPNDARNTLVYLTKKARSHKSSMPAEVLKHFDSLFSDDFPKKERENMTKSLLNIRKILNDL
ncbi:MarR family winged helix-turn-helix transcriptional regulator [Leptospira sp. SA-E8]|uniref:MarR family winged helix-turn-helix transcriptional regulator n=1 Tax=Leptospira sp. SA-E8 TaxID=3422259 RepID=UPI003EB83DC9